MVQGVFAALFGLAANKVDIEEVLPAFALERPGLYLGQVDVAQRKHCQTFE
jgi:hypothetical protein